MDERAPAMTTDPGPGRTVVEYGYGGNERLVMNMGPQHPSAHGVFRMILTLEGETIVGVDRDDGLALERENGAEHAVRGRVLRPHVHHEALVTPVPELDDLPRFAVRHQAYFIGEEGAGIRMIAFWSTSSGMALPR